MSIRPGRAKHPANSDAAPSAASEIAAIAVGDADPRGAAPVARRIDDGDAGDVEPPLRRAGRRAGALESKAVEKKAVEKTHCGTFRESCRMCHNVPWNNMNMSIYSYLST
jgi:hypothetical protein